jgi:hypothetical protein
MISDVSALAVAGSWLFSCYTAKDFREMNERLTDLLQRLRPNTEKDRSARFADDVSVLSLRRRWQF